MSRVLSVFLVVGGVVFGAVSSSSAQEGTGSPAVAAASLEDVLIPRGEIPVRSLGINAFVNDPRFGSIRSQFREVNGTLGIRNIRVLFAWTDQVQPTPSSPPFFGFYDEIVNSLPSGTNALVVLTSVPSWMNDPKNWIAGDPRRTFVERWVKPVVSRYAKRRRITGWQIGNEPNNRDFPENSTLQLVDSPENYVEMLASAANVIDDVSPSQRVVNAATTAIAQNFPESLEYNRAMVNAGLLSLVDVFAVHYYGKNIERVLVPGGVGDFLRSIDKPIWITESGARGTTKQLEYAQRIIPFLLKQTTRIQRIYLYQFTESSPAESTYGLRNLTPGKTVSDLYLHLRKKRGSTKKSR